MNKIKIRLRQSNVYIKSTIFLDFLRDFFKLLFDFKFENEFQSLYIKYYSINTNTIKYSLYTRTSLISLNMRNYLLQKHIKIS